MLKLCKLVLITILAVAVSGCAVGIYKSSPKDRERIKELNVQVEELEKLREEEAKQLARTMDLLEKRLKREIRDKQVKLKMAQRGLVITFLAEILFDSGKAKIRSTGKKVLNKVAKVILERRIEQNIGIEGHTDNVPIKYSGYRSNWELSTARATSVLHYLADERGLMPEKLSATGYGEYRPVASNATKEGRQKNRRVEIVILPKFMTEKETKLAK